VIFRFVTFSLVGVVNTLVYYLVYYLLFEVMSLDYLVASALAFLVSVINSYWLNSTLTFRDDARHSSGEFARFSIVSMAALVVNLLGMYLAVELFGIPPLLAPLLVIPLAVGVNFAGNQFWAFRRAG